MGTCVRIYTITNTSHVFGCTWIYDTPEKNKKKKKHRSAIFCRQQKYDFLFTSNSWYIWILLNIQYYLYIYTRTHTLGYLHAFMFIQWVHEKHNRNKNHKIKILREINTISKLWLYIYPSLVIHRYYICTFCTVRTDQEKIYNYMYIYIYNVIAYMYTCIWGFP